MLPFRPRPPWWPANCRPVGIVRLDEASLGLRFELASGERMTMPLRKATFKMIWPRHA